MKLKRFLTVVLMLCLAATFVFVMSSCEQEDAETEIVSVLLNKDKQNVELKATLDTVYAEKHADSTLYVIALPTSDTTKIPSNAKVLGEIKAKGKMTFKFSLADENGISRLQYAYVIAEKSDSGYAAITNAMYIQNPELLAQKQSLAPIVSDIKGLASLDVYDAKLTGAEHKLVKVNMQSFMLDEYKEGSIKYNRDGISYFFDGALVELLDEQIKTANDFGMRVYIKTTNEYIPVSSSSRTPVRVIPDMTDMRTVRRVDAFYAFLADRYSGECGQVTDYIIGDRANEIRFVEDGKKLPETETYENLYFAWARTAHAALTSVDSAARVYIPVSNNWRSKVTGVISAKTFLGRFADNSEACGDYNWAIALDLGNAGDLASLLASDSDGYSDIGVENLNEISELIDLASMRYGSEKREFIIDALNFPEKISDSNRATYYICAYYRAAEVGAKAFIYSSDLYDKDGNRNALYYMFMLCGTDNTSQLTDYTEKVDGYDAERLNKHVFKKLTFLQGAEYEIAENAKKNMTSMPVKLEELRENGITTAQMELKGSADGAYKKVLNISAATAMGTGAVTALQVDAKDIKAAKYIGITASSDNRPMLVLTVSSNSQTNKVLYVAEADLVNSESEYYFDISKLAEHINESDTLSLSLCIVSDDDTSSITVSSMALYGSSGFGSTALIITIVVILAAALLIGLIVMLAIKRKNRHQYDEESTEEA